MRIALLVVAGLALAGCVTPEERQAKIAATCQGYGFSDGTAEMAQCMQTETIALRQQQQQAAANAQRIAAQYQPQTATCTTSGAFTNCTAY